MSETTDNPIAAEVRQALKKVMDPEVGINIVDLGLVYKVNIVGRCAQIEITMTSPTCPLSALIVDDVRYTVLKEVKSLSGIQVEIVWEPPWTPERMSDEAKKILGQA